MKVEKPVDKAINYALTRSINLSREWHLYGELPSLLQIGGINFGEVVQHDMMRKFFHLFEHIEMVNTKLKAEKQPKDIYRQNDISLSSQTFHAAGAIAVSQYFTESKLQKLYRNLKNQLKLFVKSKNFGKTLGHFKLYLVNNTENNESKHIILLDTPYITYFNAVFPVIRELSGRNNCKCYVIGKEADISKKFSGVIKELDVAGIDEKESKEKARALRAYYHSKLKKDAIFHNIFEYRGINMWDLVKDDIQYFFDIGFITLAFSTAYFQRAIDTVKPDILIVGDDRVSSVRSHVLMVKKMGIPVLEIQHGIWPPTIPMDTPLSDRIATGGDYDKNVYIKFGAKKEHIVVSGWPRFDIYMKSKESFTEKPKNGVDILFATPPSVLGWSKDATLNFDVIKTIGTFIADSMHSRLIVKPHPLENIKKYNPIANKYKNVILHKSSEDISRLIASSDILIGSSTVVLEAAIVGRACIYLNVVNEESMYANSGIAIEVKKLEDIVPAIKDVLYNVEVREKLAEARKKFVYEHAYIQDGKASKRVADLIVPMIEEKQAGERWKDC